MPTDYDPFRGYDVHVDEPDVDDDELDNESEDDFVEPVYTGTTKEVLQWVGDDLERARRALDAEQSEPTPRKGLVNELKDLLDED